MSVFAGMPREQLQAALTAAQQALIELQTGKAFASVSYSQGDGAKAVTRRVTTVAECTALIAQLQAALGMRQRRRAFRFTY
ncbi:gpW family head-tail joining protein [Novosphingobium sp. BL-8A]|uniref:gpW family head-tail joining protein n=1 Tax=Novosphingobium sp. BL-8A TaxID=3127639 RepID=UPI0037584018